MSGLCGNKLCENTVVDRKNIYMWAILYSTGRSLPKVNVIIKKEMAGMLL